MESLTQVAPSSLGKRVRPYTNDSEEAEAVTLSRKDRAKARRDARAGVARERRSN